MPDLVRYYRRWLIRRLAALLPAMAAAVAVSVRQMLRLDQASPMLWIDLACLGTSLAIAGFGAWLGVRCWRCHARFRSGGASPARLLRREIEPVGPLALVGLSLSLFLAILPGCFPPPDPLSDLPVPHQPYAREAGSDPRIEPIAQSGASGTEAPAAREPRPRKTEPSPGLLLAVEPGEFRFFEEQEEPPDPWSAERPEKFGRMGVPEADRPFLWMDPELHVDVIIADPTGTVATDEGDDARLDEDLGMHGVGLRLSYDLPTAQDEALRFEYQIFAFSAGSDLVEIPESSIQELLVWQRFGITYLWRLLGYTSDATFDFSIVAGIMGDNLLSDAEVAAAWRGLRLSPYVGVEAGFWQNGPVGLLFRLGQTVPINVTGGTALVTDFTATFRVDLSTGVSVHLGYTAYWAHFRDHSERLTDTDGHERLTLIMHGPTFGVDLRF